MSRPGHAGDEEDDHDCCSSDSATPPVERRSPKPRRELNSTNTQDIQNEDGEGGVRGEDGSSVELMKKIGQGSCGAVYLAQHQNSGKEFAVKLIDKQVENDQDKNQRAARLLQRVRLESDILLRLEHPHIVRGYGIMETDEHAFLFMEYAQGGDLLELLNRKGPLPEDQARRYFCQLLRALDYLHDQGWVHRDVKCENVLVFYDEVENEEENEEVKRRRSSERLVLCDFGFAREWEPEKKIEECVGTFPYAAPEVLQRQPYTGPEVDVWSLGVVLLAMLTAQMPFGAPTGELSRALAAAGRFCVPPHASSEVVDVLTAMLNTDPELRITVDDLWHHPWLQGHTNESDKHAGKEKEMKADVPKKLDDNQMKGHPRVVEESEKKQATPQRKGSRIGRATSLFRRTTSMIRRGGSRRDRSSTTDDLTLRTVECT